MFYLVAAGRYQPTSNLRTDSCPSQRTADQVAEPERCVFTGAENVGIQKYAP